MTASPSAHDLMRGHLPDGSGIQRHSAGDYYPYVVEARETSDGLRWGVFGPDIPREFCEHEYATCREAQVGARLMAAEFRRFHSERGVRVIRSRDRWDLPAMQAAVRALEGGAPGVRVTFGCGAHDVVFRPADLPRMREKVLYNI